MRPLRPGAKLRAGAGIRSPVKIMTGADMVIQVLADEGVDVLFGYSGGAILPTWDALGRYNIEQESKRRKPIELVVPANEQGAGFMAAGYARASGKVGVSMVTSGPGATNSVTPVRDCMADSVPMVLICGQVPRAGDRHGCISGSAGFQHHERLRQARISGARSGRTRGNGSNRLRDRAQRPARARCSRYPKDIQNWKGVFKGEGVLELRGYRERMQALYSTRMPESKGAAFFDMLGKSERPLSIRRRRRHQERCGAGSAPVRDDVQHSRRNDAAGNGLVRHDASACRFTCSACTARHMRIMRSRTAIF